MNKPSTYGFFLKRILMATLLVSTHTALLAQWEALYFAHPDFPELNTLAFSTPQNGLAASDNGLVLRTTDSGLKWETVLEAPSGFDYVASQMTGPTTAFFVGRNSNIAGCGTGQGVIARTKNYGATWQFYYTDNILSATQFPTANTGFTAGSCGAIHRTIDGGDSWQLLNTGTTSSLTSVYFINEQIGFAAGVGDVFLRTTDGGDTWVNIDLPTASDYTGIQFLDESIGYVLTGERLFKTTTGGNDWTEELDIPTLSNGNFTKLFWVNENKGWIASTSAVFKTENGGDTWVLQFADTPNSSFSSGIQDLFFLDNNHGYIAGTQGYFKTSTGGESLPDIQYLSGTVFNDVLQNCVLNVSDTHLENWIVQATGNGGTYYTTSDANGYYFVALPLGTYDISLSYPNRNWINSCEPFFTETLSSPLDTLVRNLAARQAVDCPVLEVDISTAALSHCANNTYTVRYINTGTATAIAPYVVLSLDANLTMISSNWSSVSGNSYTFDLPDLVTGATGYFSFVAFLECDPIVGQTHRVVANIYPDDFCLPSSPLWDGASLMVESICQSDSVSFTIRNDGLGEMTTTQGFIIIEDHVLMSEGDVDLGPGEDTTITLYPEGTTLRLEVAQVPNHPGRSRPSAAYEACTSDNNGNISLGYINQFPADDANVFVSIDAQESTASAVTTIHKAYPKGYGDEHFIKANEDLDHHILFENNTTDTVYTVIVRDSLSAWLDAASIRRGAASHPYSFSLSGTGVAEFTFSNIQLAPGETGFIKFTIQQLVDNPDGTYIENTACIAFDFGFYNKTNTSFHQIESDFVEVAGNTQISGNITNENNEAVALVVIGNNGLSNILTDDYGDYDIENLPAMTSYTISPSKNSNITNGVDAADLYLIQQHILGNEWLDSPYKLLAADVNNSGAVSMLDVLNLQQVILLLAETFPNNQSWRFVKTPYWFEEADNPFVSNFPEAFTLSVPLMNNEVNFTAIKIGDVNNSHNPLELTDDEAEAKDKNALYLEDLRLEKGKTYEVPVYSEAQLAALQFALQWDSTALSFLGVEIDATTICRSDNFGYRFLRAGVITACWFDQNAVESNQPNQSSPTMLFRIRFTAQKDGQLSHFISLSPEHVEGLAYERKEDLSTKELKRKLTYLQFNALDQVPAEVRPLALEIFPNPVFDDNLSINYSVATETDIKITVHNSLGQLIDTILSMIQNKKGTYTHQWNTSALPEGAYYIQLQSNEAAPLLCKFVKVN
jgi:photosystem II stability/assembly factor-like uncharacterized protein